MIGWILAKLTKKQYVCRDCDYRRSNHFIGLTWCQKNKKKYKKIELKDKICFSFKKVKIDD